MGMLTSRNKECDYSAAYIIIETNTDLKGQGMTFSMFPPHRALKLC
jgi:hypothetical protein